MKTEVVVNIIVALVSCFFGIGIGQAIYENKSTPEQPVERTFLISGIEEKREKLTEVEHSRRLAPKYKAETEVRMWDGVRADLVSKHEAYEVEWAYKWKEAPAQAVLYGLYTKKEPVVILLVKDKKEEARHIYRCLLVCQKLSVRLILEEVE